MLSLEDYITEAISSRKNTVADFSEINWNLNLEKIVDILEEAGYKDAKNNKDVEPSKRIPVKKFSGKEKEYYISPSFGFSSDSLYISNCDNERVYYIGFSPRTGKMSSISEYSNGAWNEGMDIPDLKDYLSM